MSLITEGQLEDELARRVFWDCGFPTGKLGEGAELDTLKEEGLGNKGGI